MRLNRRRGLQAADICRRLRDHGAEVEEALQDLERHALAPGVLDLPVMKGLLAAVKQRTTQENTRDASIILLRGLGVGMFLLRF